ncbi:MAG: hypothetical protein KGJ79_01930 [Alphaproteobacteria bacterium]|nr:hypothetical protein [Alphaproteobacteria bacterium]MDE2493555.1 hypothetical protein [Alphaproteobacteria bacterium]
MASRRVLIAGGFGAAVLAALGYRAWDRGVFSSGQGPAFAPWREWQGRAGEGTRRPLHAAILAANAHDTQPWLFEPQEDSIAVYADRARNLGAADPFRRELYVSLGCAVANLQIAAFGYGLASDIRFVAGRLEPSPANAPVKVADIRFGAVQVLETAAAGLGRLAAAIPFRHTNRGAYFADRKIAPGVLDRVSGPLATNVRAVLIREAGARKAFGDVVVGATADFISDKQMSADSARWFRTGRREVEAHRDGVGTDTAGLSPAMAIAAKLLPDVGADAADKFWLASTRDTQVPTAAVFGLIAVRDRLDMNQALQVGYAWQMIHLTAAMHGLAAQPLNQPIEMMDRDLVLGRKSGYAAELRKVAGVEDGDPAFVFRLGYAERPAVPSPRRPLEEVIRQTGFA